MTTCMHTQKIGLYNLEPKIENTAMMQVSQFHKNKGDQVELYSPLFHDSYDKIYCFSIFDFTSKRSVRKGMIYGGTGFNITSKLPPEIEACDLDYSIFPKCTTSYLWFSRGCDNQCPFCIVHAKEGFNHPVLPKNLNPKGQIITVQDNNFFQNRLWREAITYLHEKNLPVNFASGIDIRIFNHEQGEALSKLKLAKQLHIAWDNPHVDTTDKIEMLFNYVPSWNIMCYVLIGYWSTEAQDLHRVETLDKMGVDPFVMPYNRHDPYQRRFARWVNHRSTFKSCKWSEYKG